MIKILISWLHSIIHYFMHDFIHSFIHLFIHSCIQSICSRKEENIPKWIIAGTQSESLVYSFINSIHSFIHSLIYSFIHSFNHPFIQEKKKTGRAGTQSLLDSNRGVTILASILLISFPSLIFTLQNYIRTLLIHCIG